MNNRVLVQEIPYVNDDRFINNIFCKYKISTYGCEQLLNFLGMNRAYFKYSNGCDCVSLMINEKYTGISIPNDLTREEFVIGYLKYIYCKLVS